MRATDFHTVQKCPACGDDVMVGLSMEYPTARYILKVSDVRKKKADLIEAIKESSLDNAQKEQLLDMYGDEEVLISPDVADMMIGELRTSHAKLVGDAVPETE